MNPAVMRAEHNRSVPNDLQVPATVRHDREPAMSSHSRILLDGVAGHVQADGPDLVAGDGRRVAEADATSLPPVEPTKILCVHLNHVSRVREFQIQLSETPTYFQKPTSALNSHRGQVVRPERCQWL